MSNGQKNVPCRSEARRNCIPLPTGTELQRDTERLNELLHEAERKFVSMRLGVPGEVDFGTGYVLRFAKSGAEWGLFVNDLPVLKTSRNQRILAALHLVQLQEAIHKAAVETRQSLETAIVAAGDFVKGDFDVHG